MKKNNPKDEALAKLGINGAYSSPAVRSCPVQGIAAPLGSPRLPGKLGVVPRHSLCAFSAFPDAAPQPREGPPTSCGPSTQGVATAWVLHHHQGEAGTPS